MNTEIKIAICDDEPEFVEFFSEKLKKELDISEINYMIEIFESGKSLLDHIEIYDAVFLDINMPEMDGMEVAYHINLKHSIPILFLTAHDELVYSSIKLHPFRFIRKSFVDSELSEAVQALVIHIQQKLYKSPISLHTSNGDIMIRLENITFAEIYGHWIKIHTDKSEVIECYGSLAALEREWQQFGFIKTHKSFMVNCKYVYSIQGKFVIMDGGENIPLSRYRVGAVREKFGTVMRSI